MAIRAYDAPWGAIERFQGDLDRLDPGSEKAEIIDHAISLALNRTNQPSEKLQRYDLQRNARYIVRRSWERQRRVLNRLGGSVDWQPEGDDLVAVDADTPESLFLACELARELAAAAALLGPHGVSCLRGLLRGEPVAETARQAGVSVRTIERARASLRQTAIDWSMGTATPLN